MGTKRKESSGDEDCSPTDHSQLDEDDMGMTYEELGTFGCENSLRNVNATPLTYVNSILSLQLLTKISSLRPRVNVHQAL